METMVVLARGAVNDRQWSLAYQIASQVDDLFPAGTDVSRRSYGERDEYTNLTWIAGTAAMRTNRPADALRMFERYGRAAQSQQTRAKGFFWAARAAAAAGQAAAVQRLPRARRRRSGPVLRPARVERLGRTPPIPMPATPASPAERASFASRPLAAAARHLGMIGSRSDQTLFIRRSPSSSRPTASAPSPPTSAARSAGSTWACGRRARRAPRAPPSFRARLSPRCRSRRLMAAIGPWPTVSCARKASFERSAVSSAGARGMMQLMPGTAQQAASRLGVSYGLGRLTEDPSYNVLLGNYHLSQLMDEWGGNAVLVAAAYNAGSGNVRRWVRDNGDPRRPGTDVLGWIESIPFSRPATTCSGWSRMRWSTT